MEAHPTPRTRSDLGSAPATLRALRHTPLALLFLATGTAAAAPSDAGQPACGGADEPFALPRAVASFGAATLGDRVYVYGGHVGEEHEHSRDNLSDAFYALPADLGAPARRLGTITPLQGTALVAAGDRLVRIGGLSARNAPGAAEVLVSVASVAAFDPAKAQWTALPPLPAPRSSHDAFALGERVFVAGGWTLDAEDGAEPRWCDTLLELDLAAASPAWVEHPQPFRRRALSVAANARGVYVLGGLDPAGEVRPDFRRFDPDSGTWHDLAPFPGWAFGTAMTVADGALLASGRDGIVRRYDEEANAWDEAGRLGVPRFFHRLVPAPDGGLLALGGAARTGHIAQVERWSAPGPGRPVR